MSDTNDEVPVVTSIKTGQPAAVEAVPFVAPPVEPAAAPADSGAPKPDEDVMVSVKQGQLMRIFERLDALEKDNKILRNSVSQGKLADAENATKPKELPKAYLKVRDGKVIVAWKSERAELLTHPTNPSVPVGEVLKMSVTYADGTQSEVFDQIDFTRTEDRVIVRVSDGLEALRNSNIKTVKVICEQLITAPGNTVLIEKFVMPVEAIEIRKDYLNP